jgi:hypothetical protein
MNNEDEEIAGFEGWAIVELFGRNQIAGHVTEVAMFGTSMMRVDVPESGDNPSYTKFFGGSAIYAITPTTEEIAQIAAQRLDVRPVSDWVVPDRPQLPPVAPPELDLEKDADWDAIYPSDDEFSGD